MRGVLLLSAALIATCLAAGADEKPAARVDLYGDPLPPGAVARLGTVRLRAGAFGVAHVFTRDGKTLITAGGDDRSLRFWDVASGREMRRIDEKTHQLGALAISPDGRTLAHNGDGVCLRDIETGRELQRVKALGAVSLAFSPDGKLLVTGGQDHNPIIRVFELASGKELRRMMWHRREVSGLLVLPDNKTLLSVSSPDYRLHLCDLTTGNEIRSYANQGWNDLSVQLLPDGNTVLLGGSRFVRAAQRFEPFLQLFDLEKGEPIRDFEGHEISVTGVALSPDQKTIYSSDYKGTIRIFDVATAKETGRLEPPGTVVGISPDGAVLLVKTRRGVALDVRELPSGKQRHAYDGHDGEVTSLAFSPDGKTMAASSFAGDIRLWGLATQRAKSVTISHDGYDVYVRGVAFLPDGSGVVSGASDGTLRLWSTQTGRELRKFPLTESTKREDQQQVLAMGIANDGRRLVAKSTGFSEEAPGRFWTWEIATGKLLTKREEPGGMDYHHPTFSPDGELFALQRGQEFVLANVADGRERLRIKTYEVFGWHCAFSPDQRTLALSTFVSTPTESRLGSVAKDWKIRLFELATGKERLAVPVGNYVMLLAFSPDQRHLAACVDRRLLLFDAETGQGLWTSSELDSRPRSIAFSADSKRLASGHGDGTILIWEIAALIKRAEGSMP